RTVRRIDLQLREIFRPTVALLLGGNPLERLDSFRGLTEWSLLSEADRWARERPDAERARLGDAWEDLVARRLKWRLVHTASAEIRDAPEPTLHLDRDAFAASIRERLPA